MSLKHTFNNAINNERHWAVNNGHLWKQFLATRYVKHITKSIFSDARWLMALLKFSFSDALLTVSLKWTFSDTLFTMCPWKWQIKPPPPSPSSFVILVQNSRRHCSFALSTLLLCHSIASSSPFSCLVFRRSSPFCVGLMTDFN